MPFVPCFFSKRKKSLVFLLLFAFPSRSFIVGDKTHQVLKKTRKDPATWVQALKPPFAGSSGWFRDEASAPPESFFRESDNGMLLTEWPTELLIEMSDGTANDDIASVFLGCQGARIEERG